jgi:DNA-binding NtrC family response regulator
VIWPVKPYSVLLPGEILIVDDDSEMRGLLLEIVTMAGHQALAVESGTEALTLVRDREFDVVVTDIRMIGMDGLELCGRLAEIRPEMPVIVLTSMGSKATAIAAIRAGAYDFIEKPVGIEVVTKAIERAVAYHQLKSELHRLRAAVEGPKMTNIIGESAAIKKVVELVQQVASSNATVLVTGESGTGKELVARGLHDLSDRRDEPFIALNCAAISPGLIESELFGHVRGAFTDARKDRRGLFVQAAGGTIFLDEIGELSLEVQAKLLRVLQERKVKPVGSDVELGFEARLVTATNRDLETEVEENRFRADLFYRVNVVQINVPPLRARRGDILILAQHFLLRHATRGKRRVEGIATPAAAKLLAYDWPGNVRELENCMERAVALSRMSEITTDDLPDRVRDHKSTALVIAADDPEEMITLVEMQRRYLRRVLEAVSGNKTHAARVLGIDRRTLYRHLEDGNPPTE